MDLAPIVLFVYNRPDHTRNTLEALANNEFASHSSLYIFADGPKNRFWKQTIQQIEKTREIINSKQWCKEVIIKEHSFNKGLSNSIIDGVTEIVNKYGKVIVLEDDLITSKYFLKFMNEGLLKYETDDKVMQISGHTFPTETKPEHQSYFLPMITSWGWATWKRAWHHFDANAAGYEELKTNSILFKKFDIDGSYPYAKMLFTQMETDIIDSWAIRWYWSVFKQDGLTLFPDASLVHNFGYGSEATHTNSYNPYLNKKFDNAYFVQHFPEKVERNNEYFIKIKKSINKSGGPSRSFLQRLKNNLRVFNLIPDFLHWQKK